MQLFASAVPHFPPQKTPMGLPVPPSSSSSSSSSPSLLQRSSSLSLVERYGTYSSSSVSGSPNVSAGRRSSAATVTSVRGTECVCVCLSTDSKIPILSMINIVMSILEPLQVIKANVNVYILTHTRRDPHQLLFHVSLPTADVVKVASIQPLHQAVYSLAGSTADDDVTVQLINHLMDCLTTQVRKKCHNSNLNCDTVNVYMSVPCDLLL